MLALAFLLAQIKEWMDEQKQHQSANLYIDMFVCKYVCDFCLPCQVVYFMCLVYIYTR